MAKRRKVEFDFKTKEKRKFVKKIYWTTKTPNWICFFSALTIIYFSFILCHYLNTLTNIKTTFWISVVMIFFEYILFGKYPYIKTYYEEV